MNSAVEKIVPSILSADFAKLGEEVRTVQACGVKWIHVDVMDGHFVPNITIGPVVVSSLKKTTPLVLDVHLMITNPERYIEAFAKSGAGVLTVHQETCPNLPQILTQIKKFGCKAGVSINPQTPVEKIHDVLNQVDLVLVMTVQPGFGGQKFMSECLPKIEALCTYRKKHNLKFSIEVDGGLNKTTIASVAKAGADLFVAGSAIFNDKDGAQKAIQELSESI